MNKKPVKMFLSESGYKRFEVMRKKMGFNNDDLFLKYCVVKTILPRLTQEQQKDARAEMKRLRQA